MPRTLPLLLLLAASPLAAQGGTTVWSVRASLPDSLQARTAGMSEFDLRVTLATDGSRIAMQIDPGPTMIAASGGVDLTAARLLAVVHAEGDSFSVGLVLPPDLAAQMGGGIGLRIDGAIPDSVPMPMASLDSLMAANEEQRPKVVDTGRRDTVAGIACEEWEMTSVAADTTGFDTVTMCLAESLPAFTVFNTLLKRHFPSMAANFDELQSTSREWFGGRNLVAIRTVMGTDQSMVVQLELARDTAPDPSFFILPEGLQPFPMQMLQGMVGAAREQSDT